MGSFFLHERVVLCNDYKYQNMGCKIFILAIVFLYGLLPDANAEVVSIGFSETFNLEVAVDPTVAGKGDLEMPLEGLKETRGSENLEDIPLSVLPSGWKKLTFPKIDRETDYRVIDYSGNFVLKAMSSNSASGVVKKVKIDLKEFPILSWRWKVEDVLEGGNARLKSGDDYPARIYITFKYEPSKVPFWERVLYKLIKLIYGEVPSSAINYIWANKLDHGAMVDNPYTDKVVMFAVESGGANKGKWMSESRNLYEDYLQAFGKEPTLVTTIAVMTDTDNTGETAVAYYDDLTFSSHNLK